MSNFWISEDPVALMEVARAPRLETDRAVVSGSGTSVTLTDIGTNMVRLLLGASPWRWRRVNRIMPHDCRAELPVFTDIRYCDPLVVRGTVVSGTFATLLNSSEQLGVGIGAMEVALNDFGSRLLRQLLILPPRRRDKALARLARRIDPSPHQDRERERDRVLGGNMYIEGHMWMMMSRLWRKVRRKVDPPL